MPVEEGVDNTKEGSTGETDSNISFEMPHRICFLITLLHSYQN